MAFLPWVKDDAVTAEAAEPAVDAIAELSAHVARRDTAPSAAPAQSSRADDTAAVDSVEDDAAEEDSFAEDLPEEPDPEQIADRIVRGLSRKSLSVAEVEARLYTEGVAEKDAIDILERFARFGYLDDYKMAESLVLQLRERKKLGRSSIMQELRARKLDPDAIATALDEFDGDDEYRTAMELARKRLPSLRSLSDEVAERRLTGFLARRGYAGALVQRVVRETVRKPGSSVRFR
ncbi:regulatory protein RecX [Rathayibacter festucae]|uniref:regulatory protein RecX n=1 Tax=Rathayibacter festucae TaxID=110937 RepID=UPI002A6B8E99|nr:regulatory protein RecX [Rathayibacter festucae]MDY0913071.1 regulatory protein RecX [Rathayibacter festucae]